MLAVIRNPAIEQPAKFSSDAFLVFVDKVRSQFCGFGAEYKFSVLQPFVLGSLFSSQKFQ